MKFTVKLIGENYYLRSGPSGMAFGRGKSKAHWYDNQKSAEAAASLFGDLGGEKVEVVQK